jgi:hypothetical protein
VSRRVHLPLLPAPHLPLSSGSGHVHACTRRPATIVLVRGACRVPAAAPCLLSSQRLCTELGRLHPLRHVELGRAPANGAPRHRRYPSQPRYAHSARRQQEPPMACRARPTPCRPEGAEGNGKRGERRPAERGETWVGPAPVERSAIGSRETQRRPIHLSPPRKSENRRGHLVESTNDTIAGALRGCLDPFSPLTKI